MLLPTHSSRLQCIRKSQLLYFQVGCVGQGSVRKLEKMRELSKTINMKKLSVPPKLVTKLYSMMEAYGNHY
jgi:hypothetical protein